MKQFFIFVILISLVSFCQAQEKDAEAVQACFAGYKKALLNNEGEKSLNFLSQKTFNYYGDILIKSLKADSVSVDKLNIMDKLMVFSLRHRTPADKLLSFNKKSVIVYAIEKGMISKSSVATNEVGSVKVTGNSAQAQLVSNGRETEMYFGFNKEKDGWKLDLTSIFPIANKVFEKLLEDDGRGENEYLFFLLNLISGEEVGDDIWKPIVK